MAQNTAAVERGSSIEMPVLGLGKAGWILWGLISLMNLLVVVDGTVGMMAIPYTIFVLVGAYVWMRVAKFIIQKLGSLGSS